MQEAPRGCTVSFILRRNRRFPVNRELETYHNKSRVTRSTFVHGRRRGTFSCNRRPSSMCYGRSGLDVSASERASVRCERVEMQREAQEMKQLRRAFRTKARETALRPPVSGIPFSATWECPRLCCFNFLPASACAQHLPRQEPALRTYGR